MYLPLANILHHKLSSALNALGIGIGVCMLITLTGLSRGSLYEVADRMESVNADLMVVPPGLADKTMTLSGVALEEKIAPILEKRFADSVARAVPVSIGTIKLANQDQRAFGIRPADWNLITNNAKITGRIFDPQNRFANWLDHQLLGSASNSNEDDDEDDADDSANSRQAKESEPLDLSNKLTGENYNGLELVIDSRLAKAGNYKIGQKIQAANHTWTIVGIVKSGVATRVFMPLRTAQFLFGSGDITKCTMIFIKLTPHKNPAQSAREISKSLDLDIMPLSAYRQELIQKFGIMFTYVDAVNAIALCIAFLFVMITLYTMVLQRTREIAILKSAGASNFFITRQVLAESLTLTSAGCICGIILSIIASLGIEHYKPLLTVDLTFRWVVTAIIAALAGATLAAIYPAWRAIKIDMSKALSYE